MTLPQKWKGQKTMATENNPNLESPVCKGNHCGICCGGECSRCGVLELTREEAAFLVTFAELPFQPVVSKADLKCPVYAYRSLDAGEDTVNDISPETISSLVDKYLIQIDYDIPLNNYNYLGFEDYPLLVNCSMPGLPVHQQLLEFTHTHIHRVSDAIQPSHPLSSPSPPAPNPSQHQSLFQ